MREAGDFLAAHGFGSAAPQPLPGDAGFRRYARLLGGPRPALLMDAPPPEDVRPYLAIGAHLRALGLSAPEVMAADAERGLLIIEDLGAATHADLLDAGTDPVPLYAEAAEALAALHDAAPPPGLPAWDASAMAKATAATFLDWWWPAAFGAPPADAVRAALPAALHAMLDPFAAAGFVHRDFFPANLLRIPGRDGPRRTGIIDFQDAGRGHPAYDLVSLVEDARRDVAPAARAAALGAYRARRAVGDLEAALAVHGAQRHLRVAALWVRLALRDGKPRYLVHGPRCWALLDRALAHPATAPLRQFLDRHVPRDLRRNPDRVLPGRAASARTDEQAAQGDVLPGRAASARTDEQAAQGDVLPGRAASARADEQAAQGDVLPGRAASARADEQAAQGDVLPGRAASARADEQAAQGDVLPGRAASARTDEQAA